MSPCNIPFLTSLKLMHIFASNFVWMFHGRIPTMFLNIEVKPLFLMELCVIWCNILQILRYFSLKLLTRNHSNIMVN